MLVHPHLWSNQNLGSCMIKADSRRPEDHHATRYRWVLLRGVKISCVVSEFVFTQSCGAHAGKCKACSMHRQTRMNKKGWSGEESVLPCLEGLTARWAAFTRPAFGSLARHVLMTYIR